MDRRTVRFWATVMVTITYVYDEVILDVDNIPETNSGRVEAGSLL